MTIGSRIRAARDARGLSQGALARAVDVRDGTISRYEHDAFIPSAPVLKRIARALEVTVDSLLDDSIPPPADRAAE